MEHTEEFESWLLKLINDAKQKLNLSNRTIAYILLREGTKYYLAQIMNEEIKVTK